MPNREVKVFPNNKPWFRKEHHLLRKRVQRLYRQALRLKQTNHQIWAIYKNEKNSYLALCRQSKEDLTNRQLHYLASNDYSAKAWWRTTKSLLGKTSTSFIPPIFYKNSVFSTLCR